MAGWLKETKKDVEIKIILFLISPFISFLYSLRRLNTKSSYIVIFLSSIFFGIAFNAEKVVNGEFNYDSSVYRMKFENYVYINFYEYKEGFISFLEFDDGKKDYYFDTIAFYISRITDNYHYLFMVFSIVFSYFFLKSLKFFTQEEKFNFSLICFILLFLFTFNQIFNINGARFWTAAWVAVYCIFQVHRNNKNYYILLALITPFIHGTYWVFVFILFSSIFLVRYNRFWTILFFISFLASTLAIEFIKLSQSYLPEFLSKMVDQYTSEENMQKGWSGFGWLPEVFKYLVIFYTNFLVFLFIRHSTEIKSNIKTENLYSFLLMWVTIFNFMMIIPSLGSRYIQLSYPIIAYIWLVVFYRNKYDYVVLFLPFVFVWEIIRYFIYYKDVLDVSFYFSSPVYIVYKYLISFNGM